MQKDDFGLTALSALNKNKQAASDIVKGNININKDTKSDVKRIQRGFLMPTDLIEDLTDLANLYGLSFTEFVNTQLKKVVEGQKTKLETYRKLREEINNE